ncbi:MAG: Gfo/Idh/MocA family oxidoreductase [Gemmatimonadetes bacterium]|nr:Gfo/Idh/MocA family oxidoreductase [Gemmatimonadota bacterium]
MLQSNTDHLGPANTYFRRDLPMCASMTAAIVGCGDIAHAHACGYQLAGVDIIAYIDPLAVARDQFRQEYGGGVGYESIEEMFDAGVTPDMISICAWHLLHAPLTVAAARPGVKAILCEKPMAVGLGDADGMIEACEAAGVKLAISHQRRFTLGWEKGRELVAAGHIGEPQFAVTKLGHGLLNCGTHAIDGARFVLGDPTPQWVMGAVHRDTGRIERDVPIEDGCLGLVHFDNGIQLMIESDLDMEGATVGTFQIRGADGMMEVGETHCRTMTSQGWEEHDLGVPREQIDVIGGQANGRQAKELVAWIDGSSETHRCAAAQSRVTVEIMMALLESARQNAVIQLPLQEMGYPLDLMLEEGKLPHHDEADTYDIRAFLKRDDIDEAAYTELRATGMGHHPIMRTLWDRAQAD